MEMDRGELAKGERQKRGTNKKKKGRGFLLREKRGTESKKKHGPRVKGPLAGFPRTIKRMVLFGPTRCYLLLCCGKPPRKKDLDERLTQRQFSAELQRDSRIK